MVVQEEENLEYDEGTVYKTKPAAGEKIQTGDEIILYVAVGMKSELMPGLTGVTQEEAEKLLKTLVEDLKLKVEVEEEYKKGVEEGVVIRTAPSYNETIRTGDTVTLYVCAQQKAQMPDLVGKTVEEAKGVLEDAGFTKVKEVEGSSGEKKGIVQKQSHEKGEEIPVDTEITLEVCVGPKKMTIEFELPGSEGDDPGEVSVVITNVTTGKEVYSGMVSATKDSIEVEVSGFGKMTFEVTVDGMVYSTGPDIIVDFDKG